MVFNCHALCGCSVFYRSKKTASFDLSCCGNRMAQIIRLHSNNNISFVIVNPFLGAFGKLLLQCTQNRKIIRLKKYLAFQVWLFFRKKNELGIPGCYRMQKRSGNQIPDLSYGY